MRLADVILKTMAENMSNEISRYLFVPKHCQDFVVQKIANFVYASQNKSVSCKLCHITAASNLLPQHTSYKNSDIVDNSD